MKLGKASGRTHAKRAAILFFTIAPLVLFGVSCQVNAIRDHVQAATAYLPAEPTILASVHTLAPTAAAPTLAKTFLPSSPLTPTFQPTMGPTLRGYAGYPVPDTTPGGITILSKGEVILVPNPVKSPRAEWKIYAEPRTLYPQDALGAL